METKIELTGDEITKIRQLLIANSTGTDQDKLLIRKFATRKIPLLKALRQAAADCGYYVPLRLIMPVANELIGELE